MSDERKPSEDLKEGLGLIFRAARSAAKQVDVSKIDKGLDKAISQASRVATHVGRAVADEINRMSSSTPPWQSGSDKSAGVKDPPPAEEGEGHVWASDAQQSEPTPSDKDAADKSDEGEPTKVRVETETDKT